MCLKCRKVASSRIKSERDTCMSLYSEIVNLDSKIVSLYDSIKDSKLLELNKQCREWIKNLKRECPPEEDLTLIKEIVNEYTINQGA